MVEMWMIQRIILHNAAILLGLFTKLAVLYHAGAQMNDASQWFSRVGSFTGNNSTELVAVQTVMQSASSCGLEDTCFGYTFHAAISQCELYRGCINITSQSENDDDDSGKEAYVERYKTDLALGKNVITASGKWNLSPDMGVLTDGSWLEDYLRGGMADMADVFCTNNDNEGCEKWIQFDLEQSYVICAVDIYVRVGSGDYQLGRPNMLVTVNDEPQLLSDRDQSECGFRADLMTLGDWNLIKCDRLRKGRHVRIEQIFVCHGTNSRVCAYEILIYGY